MAKNRYKLEGNILTGLDLSYTATNFIESDENLILQNENGINIYQVVSGEIIERSQAEIDNDYLPIYIEQKITDARELLYSRWPDSSKTITANKAQYELFKSGSYSNIAAVDAAYNDFILFMDIS